MRAAALILSLALLAMLCLSWNPLNVSGQSLGAFDQWEVQVVGLESPDELPDILSQDVQRPRGRYIAVLLNVSNVGRTAERFRESDLTLVDSQDRVFTAVDATTDFIIEQDYEIDDFQPGFTYETAVVFDVPPDAEGFLLSTENNHFRLPLDVVASVDSSPDSNLDVTPAATTVATGPARKTVTPDRQRVVRALATRVATLEATITPLQERVDSLDATVTALTTGGDERTPTTETPVSNEARTARRVEVSGVGTDVSEKFRLAPGRYRVVATMNVTQFDGFICSLLGPNGFEETLFNELIDSPRNWTARTVVEVEVAGDYFVEVSNTEGRWTLQFAPY